MEVSLPLQYLIAYLVKDINNLILQVDNISFYFYRRTANQATYRITKLASYYCISKIGL